MTKKSRSKREGTHVADLKPELKKILDQYTQELEYLPLLPVVEYLTKMTLTVEKLADLAKTAVDPVTAQQAINYIARFQGSIKFLQKEVERTGISTVATLTSTLHKPVETLETIHGKIAHQEKRRMIAERINAQDTLASIDAELVKLNTQKFDLTESKDDLPDLTIHLKQKTKSLAVARDCLPLLKEIYTKVYDNDASEIKVNKIEKLSINRNTEFWKYITFGFTHGKAVDFLNKLKDVGLYDMLFPSFSPEHKEQNDKWLKEYLTSIDLAWENNSQVQLFKNPFRSNIQAILVAKELLTASEDERKKVQHEYNVSPADDGKFKIYVLFLSGNKKRFLDGLASAVGLDKTVTQSVASAPRLN